MQAYLPVQKSLDNSTSKRVSSDIWHRESYIRYGCCVQLLWLAEADGDHLVRSGVLPPLKVMIRRT